MFDTLILEVKCPRCGEQQYMHCKTKELDCGHRFFKKGDSVHINRILTEITNKEMLFCKVECTSKKCNSTECKTEFVKKKGYEFAIYALMRGDTITGEYIHIGEA